MKPGSYRSSLTSPRMDARGPQKRARPGNASVNCLPYGKIRVHPPVGPRARQSAMPRRPARPSGNPPKPPPGHGGCGSRGGSRRCSRLCELARSASGQGRSRSAARWDRRPVHGPRLVPLGGGVVPGPGASGHGPASVSGLHGGSGR